MISKVSETFRDGPNAYKYIYNIITYLRTSDRTVNRIFHVETRRDGDNAETARGEGLNSCISRAFERITIKNVGGDDDDDEGPKNSR